MQSISTNVITLRYKTQLMVMFCYNKRNFVSEYCGDLEHCDNVVH